MDHTNRALIIVMIIILVLILIFYFLPQGFFFNSSPAPATVTIQRTVPVHTTGESHVYYNMPSTTYNQQSYYSTSTTDTMQQQ